MKKVLVNYASPGFVPYQRINRLTGELFGFNEVHCYSPADLDPNFVDTNSQVLSAERGAGYWLWKPYVVLRSLRQLDAGDILCYCDATAHFVNPIEPMIKLMSRERIDLLAFGQGFTEAQYTKRDAFVLMDCDSERFTQTPQRFSPAFVLRKSPWSDRFAAEFLRYAQDRRILTDDANEMGLPNYADFIDHRHDQSIFSLLSKRHNVGFFETGFLADDMPKRESQVINHTRRHLPPETIVLRLVEQGVLSPSDLYRLEQPS